MPQADLPSRSGGTPDESPETSPRSSADHTTSPPGPTDGSPRPVAFGLILLMFIGSGFTGLVDQLCFSKYLSYVVGSTAYAVSAVLAAFMSGLALGAFLGGKLSSRVERPLLAYGVLELVVTAAVVAAPAAFTALTPAYLALLKVAPGSLLFASVARWLLAVLFVMVPTIAMGATLPLLSRIVGAGLKDSEAGRARKERRLGRLYAANTLGGALGALGAAYLILPWLGLSRTLYAAGLGSGLIGLIAIWQGAGLRAPSASAEGAESVSVGKLFGVLAFASGALVFACEVIFTHLLALVIGNSAYAFGLILAVFLICLFAGASLAPRVARRYGSAALPLGLGAAALGLALTLPAWDSLPLLFGGLGAHVTSFAGREAVRAGAAFLILVLPTTLMGLTFPLLLQRVAAERQVGALVGRLTAINTVGAVFGALGAGYLLLPQLGSQRALSAVGIIFAALTLGASSLLPKERGTRASRVIAAVALALSLISPRWDLARLTSGVNVYFDSYDPPSRILFLREDIHGGVTSVTQTDSLITLYTNGKFQGNNGHELLAQYSFAHFPSLFVKRWERALVIGLGTATTLGTLNGYPWKQVDVVEISPAIAHAARTYFPETNRHALEDPRVRLHLDDGRNHLLVHPDRYDLIGMELSSIWFSGASALYSREYYELVKSRLEPHGVFQQWVQLHHMDNHSFARILGSLRQVFPHVALFYSGGQGILLASSEPLSASRSAAEALSARPAIRETLSEGAGLIDLMQYVLLTGSGFDDYLAAEAERSGLSLEQLVSTDDNLYLEYATPKANVLPWEHRYVLLRELERFKRPEAAAALTAP